MFSTKRKIISFTELIKTFYSIYFFKIFLFLKFKLKRNIQSGKPGCSVTGWTNTTCFSSLKNYHFLLLHSNKKIRILTCSHYLNRYISMEKQFFNEFEKNSKNHHKNPTSLEVLHLKRDGCIGKPKIAFAHFFWI